MRQGHRLVELDLGEFGLVVVVTAMIDRPAELERAIKQVRLSKRQRLVALILADLELQAQAFALAEQVIRRVIDADERAG